MGVAWSGRRAFLWIIPVVLFFLFHSLNQSQEPPLLRYWLASYIHNRREILPKHRGPDQIWRNSRQRLQEPSRVAICLVGGARSFELTGPTINKFVLDVYGNSDVFLHAPLDKDAFKFFLLNATSNSTRFAAARIFQPVPIQEEDYQKELLTASGSPNGVQGLLQYFNLVEGCWDLITNYEREHHIQYDWILRTRVDGYWNQPIPPISTLQQTHYTIPYGSQFGGVNDRLGIGSRSSSEIALRRHSLLPLLHRRGFRNLNSEGALRAQLHATNTRFQLKKFPFCILSSRRYTWPPGEWDVPVMALSSRGPLNGAKCRPCRPKVAGKEAAVVAEALNRGWSWSGPNEGVELCDASREWEEGWQDAFDEAAGEHGREIRVRVAGMDREDCVQSVSRFQKVWNSWEAPAAEKICKEKFEL